MIDDHNGVILCIITLLSNGIPRDITSGMLGNSSKFVSLCATFLESHGYILKAQEMRIAL